MSRSRRHTPKTGITTAGSEKQDKRHAAGRLRCLARAALAGGASVLPGRRDVFQWGAKDGKAYWTTQDLAAIARKSGAHVVRKMLGK